MLCRPARPAFRSHNLLWRRTVSVVIAEYSSKHTEPSEHSSTVASRMRRLDTWTRFFDQEQRFALTPRIEKISVDYVGKFGKPTSLRMTKGISTPVDCAKHLSQLLEDRSAIALVNGQPWDMHRPLVDNCELDFVHFKDSYHDPTVANEAFWRSSALLMAATLEAAFRPEHQVRLLSLPTGCASPSNGAFTCDITFSPSAGVSDPSTWWRPTTGELQAISQHGQRLAAKGLPFQVVDMPVSMVKNELFGGERLRQSQVEPREGSDGSGLDLPVHRMGDYVEVCAGGPLITSTKLIGRFAVARLSPLGWLAASPHPDHDPDPDLDHDRDPRRLVYRAHGVALPTSFLTHFTTFDRLIRWAGGGDGGGGRLPDCVVPTGTEVSQM